jgi:protein-tyrosine phosphatase
MTKEDRLLPLKSLRNTRELGGYETQEGSFTKTHCYIRGATPAFLNEEDASYLYDYGRDTPTIILDPSKSMKIEKVYKV